MRGVVAAGNVHSVDAATAMLEAGGNAVDAAVAAAMTCFAAEPLLASAGGAGIMVIGPADRPAVAVDFFSHVPGLGLARKPTIDFEGIEVDFGAVRQAFHVGRASATVPMVLDGLAVAAREFGSLPLPMLAKPAIDLAREGVPIDPFIARTFVMLWAILQRDPRCMEELAQGLSGERPPQVGERLCNPLLAATLAEFAERGESPERLRRGLLEEFGPARGGLITPDDLGVRVQLVEPHRFEFGDWTIATSPRMGGRLVARIAQQLMAGPVPDSEPDSILALARASLAGHQARSQLGSTTHVSVVDERGVAACVTLTSGEGCGHVVTGTGVHVNNFLGEEDLNPAGFHRHPAGNPLPTMIAPTVARHRDGRVVALGSGGSNRIRSAVAQVLVRVIRGAAIEQAVAAPRVHAEDSPKGSEVWLELADLAHPDAARLALAGEFGAVHDFPGRDFFFGGVHTVELDAGGKLLGVGDSRRFGVARVSA
jgi:gamma-glutamyltranspeptidase/glutathione hydrolase